MSSEIIKLNEEYNLICEMNEISPAYDSDLDSYTDEVFIKIYKHNDSPEDADISKNSDICKFIVDQVISGVVFTSNKFDLVGPDTPSKCYMWIGYDRSLNNVTYCCNKRPTGDFSFVEINLHKLFKYGLFNTIDSIKKNRNEIISILCASKILNSVL